MTGTEVRVGRRRLRDYSGAALPGEIDSLRRQAEPFAGLRVLHLSAGPFGGAVAETLAGLVPLQRDLGLLADWYVFRGEHRPVWQAVYDGAAGARVRWGPQERTAWYTDAARLMAGIDADYDVIVVHDPQVVALPLARPKGHRARWIWHCHLDLRSATPALWADLRHACQVYSAALFPAPALIPADLGAPRPSIARPAIDPAAPKNLPLPTDLGDVLIRRLGLDPNRPLIGQFSPIDRRYAPIAALGTYWLARREIPGLQIVLADATLSARAASGDLAEVREAAAGDPDIHILPADRDLGATTINALQRQVVVALQLAVPAGLSWGIAECQWKEKPVVLGRSGLLPDLVDGGRAGFVAAGAPDAAETVVRLIRDADEARRIGRAGHEHIARHHTLTGLAADHLRALEIVLKGTPVRQGSTRLSRCQLGDLHSRHPAGQTGDQPTAAR